MLMLLNGFFTTFYFIFYFIIVWVLIGTSSSSLNLCRTLIYVNVCREHDEASLLVLKLCKFVNGGIPWRMRVPILLVILKCDEKGVGIFLITCRSYGLCYLWWTASNIQVFSNIVYPSTLTKVIEISEIWNLIMVHITSNTKYIRLKGKYTRCMTSNKEQEDR